MYSTIQECAVRPSVDGSYFHLTRLGGKKNYTYSYIYLYITCVHYLYVYGLYIYNITYTERVRARPTVAQAI